MPPRQRHAIASLNKQLPEAIWLKIAGYMSVKEWAKASGTCKTTQTLRLEAFLLSQDLPEEGIKWVCQRLSTVTVLHIHTESLQHLAQSAGLGSTNLKSLKQLHVSLYRPKNDIKMSLAWLLSQAANLELLTLICGPLPWFPPATQLKHLSLSLYHSAGNFVPALRCASGLHTLHLGAALEFFDCPGLCLRELKHLGLVALCGVRPAELLLPPNCLFSLKCSEKDLANKVYMSAIDHLHRFQMERIEMALVKIPPILCNARSNLSRVKIRMTSFGGASSHLPLDGLAHVENLCLVGKDLYINVPSVVSWKHAVFLADNTLTMVFEDVNRFSRDVTEVCFFYRCLQETWVAELCAALQQLVRIGEHIRVSLCLVLFGAPLNLIR